MSTPESTPTIRPRGVDGAIPRILVVDDEQYMCDVCARTLQRTGYHVTTTTNANTAAELLTSEQRFDLLLTDIKMPAMSGLDLARIAHEQDPAIAIIVMTGFASKENLQQSVQRGVADFLQKPFELDQLRFSVEQALHKRSLLQDNLRLQTFSQLLANSEAFNATLDLQELSTTLLRITLAQSGSQAGFVLVDQGTSVFASPEEATLLEAGRALAIRAANQRESLVGANTAFCQIGGKSLNNAVAIALHAQGEVSGVLLLCGERPSLRAGLSEELALMASHAGAALRNAVLYSQLNDAYARLQELDGLKGEFIAIASHELRTPLSIVLGYTMMLRDQAPTSQFQDFTQRIFENAQRIRDIVDDMVSLRHLDTGESDLNLEPTDLNQLVQQAYTQMQPMSSERQQTMSLSLLETSVSFLCDREKVLLILAHLIANAIRFTPESGVIGLRASVQPGNVLPAAAQASLATQPEFADWVLIDVQDTGIGIPEREQQRIFDRFYQVANSLTRDHGGIGLGLAIVRELAVVLGGTVWVTSSEGEGSTFTLALPFRQE